MHAPKIDSLQKHARKRKALMADLGVSATNEYYMNKDIVHAQNERLYATVKKDSILKQVCHAAIGERKKKPVQFSMCCHMFVERRLVIDFENMSKILHFLTVDNFPKPIGQTQMVGRCHRACMTWLSTKPKHLVKLLGSFPFHVMK
jgi:hypothetical protein